MIVSYKSEIAEILSNNTLKYAICLVKCAEKVDCLLFFSSIFTCHFIRKKNVSAKHYIWQKFVQKSAMNQL